MPTIPLFNGKKRVGSVNYNWTSKDEQLTIVTGVAAPAKLKSFLEKSLMEGNPLDVVMVGGTFAQLGGDALETINQVLEAAIEEGFFSHFDLGIPLVSFPDDRQY